MDYATAVLARSHHAELMRQAEAERLARRSVAARRNRGSVQRQRRARLRLRPT